MWRFDTGGTKATLGRDRNGKHYLSVFSAYLSAAAILCDRFLSRSEILKAKQKREEARGNAKVKKFEVFSCGRFSSLSAILETKRNRQETRNFENLKRATKNGHTVWPPPINRRMKGTISGKIVVPFLDRAPSGCGACFGVCGCCLVVAMCARAGGPPAAQRPPAPRAVRRRRAAASRAAAARVGGGGPPPPNGRRIFFARGVNLGRAAAVWWCFGSLPLAPDDDCSGLTQAKKKAKGVQNYDFYIVDTHTYSWMSR